MCLQDSSSRGTVTHRFAGKTSPGTRSDAYELRNSGISTQLHRGIAGSTTFINVAEWESIEAFRAAASKPEFQASLSGYPDSAVASPHLGAVNVAHDPLPPLAGGVAMVNMMLGEVAPAEPGPGSTAC